MIKFGTKQQLKDLTVNLPTNVIANCLQLINILDEEYGSNRNITEDYGGFIVLLQDTEDVQRLNSYNLDLYTDINEGIDIIKTDNGIYISALYLLSSDFAINIIADITILPTLLLTKWGVTNG